MSVGATGFEPATSCTPSTQGVAVSDAEKELTSTTSFACTVACTSDGKSDYDETVTTPVNSSLEAVAAALLGLSPAERAKLVAMLSNGATPN